jgi:hypothetical protein
MRSFRVNRLGVLQMIVLASLATTLALASPALSSTATTKSGKPHVSTGGVAHVHETSGQLSGTVNPEGLQSTFYFQYGPTAAYGSQTPTVTLAAGSTSVKVGQTVSGLLPGYHYRLVASNKDGQVDGKDKTFTGAAKRLKFEFAKQKGRDRVTSYRGTYILSGTLTGIGNGNHPVMLQANPYPYKGTFAAVGPITATNAAGAFSFHISQLTQSTKFRLEAVGARPIYSSPLTVSVAVKVTIHVRSVAHASLARVYGTVAPAVAGVVIVEVMRPAKETSKREASGPRAVAVGATKLKRATATLSRFSVVLSLPGTGHYRVYVKLAKGPLVSGNSPNILVRILTPPTKGKGKAKLKKKA